MSKTALPLVKKDKREFLAELEQAFKNGAGWAMAIYQQGDRYTITATDGPNRLEMIGALEDLKFDLLDWNGDPEEGSQ